LELLAPFPAPPPVQGQKPISANHLSEENSNLQKLFVSNSTVCSSLLLSLADDDDDESEDWFGCTEAFMGAG
jgi:hypothetical protein